MSDSHFKMRRTKRSYEYMRGAEYALHCVMLDCRRAKGATLGAFPEFMESREISAFIDDHFDAVEAEEAEEASAPRSPILPLGANGCIARALAERDGGVLLRAKDDGVWREFFHREMSWMPDCWHEREQPSKRFMGTTDCFDACAPLPGASPWLQGPPPAEEGTDA